MYTKDIKDAPHTKGKTKAKVMLLSAGFGTRMRPLTDTTPKPLIHVGGQSQIQYTVDMFQNAGYSDIVVNAYYLKDSIIEYFKDKKDIHISAEPDILETGGGVKYALDLLQDSFFVSNTDSIVMNTNENIINTLDQSWNDTTDVLLAVIDKDKATGYAGTGDFSIAPDGTLTRDKSGQYVFIGIQKIRKSLFENIAQDNFSLNVIYDKALQTGTLKGVIHTGNWYHISTPKDVDITNALFSEQ